MTLQALLDFVAGTSGKNAVAEPRHDDRTSHSASQDRLGFCALQAAALMDRLGFLYAPHKLDPGGSRPPARFGPRPGFPQDA